MNSETLERVLESINYKLISSRCWINKVINYNLDCPQDHNTCFDCKYFRVKNEVKSYE